VKKGGGISLENLGMDSDIETLGELEGKVREDGSIPVDDTSAGMGFTELGEPDGVGTPENEDEGRPSTKEDS
jgi:hypothetical protein